jgi:hypothetical protein
MELSLHNPMSLSQLYKETAPLKKGESKRGLTYRQSGPSVAQVARADVYAMSDDEEGGLRDEERDEE